MPNFTPLERRRMVLATIYFAPGGILRLPMIRQQLETVHGCPVTLDALRADLNWLADIGMASVRDDAAMVTEAGAEVVSLRAKLPGE